MVHQASVMLFWGHFLASSLPNQATCSGKSNLNLLLIVVAFLFFTEYKRIHILLVAYNDFVFNTFPATERFIL